MVDTIYCAHLCLEELMRKFTTLCINDSSTAFNSVDVFTFYEKQATDLTSKVPLLGFLSCLFRHKKPVRATRLTSPRMFGLFTDDVQLVGSHSANLPYVSDPLPLNRNHQRMNKFQGPRESDHNYKLVVDKICDFLDRIREGNPLEKADASIRDNCYNKKKIEIVRLSGERRSTEDCYINLTIVEQHDGQTESQKDHLGGLSPPSSRFSWDERLAIGTSYYERQVALSELFDQREIRSSVTIIPRRILIRGRAGIGKTTLCKKIVHDFTYERM
jgi:hypothetical protein